MVRLRPAALSDVPVLAAIEATAFSDPWPASAFQELMVREYVRMRVAVDAADRPLGYCVLLKAADEGEIANIATAAEARRKGVGARLLDDALIAAQKMGIHSVFLEVRGSNSAARGLYQSRGFIPVGRRRGYYQVPLEDALVLRKSLGARAPNAPPAPSALR